MPNTVDLSHVNEHLWELTQHGSRDQRIQYLQGELFVWHPAAEVGAQQLLEMQRTDRGRRPCGALIIGASGMGKSQLVEAFGRRLIAEAKDDGSLAVDIVIIEPSWEGEP